MMFADDMVLCATDKDSLEDDLEIWREALEKRGLKVSGTKTEHMYLNGEARGSVNMKTTQLLEVTEFKYLGSIIQKDGGREVEVNRRIQSGWKKLEDVRSPL